MNFAEDLGIPNVPEIENMGLAVLVSPDYETLEIDHGSAYMMDQFRLEIVEGADEPGISLLVATGVSPPITKMIDDLSKKHEGSFLEDDEDPWFVISNNLEDIELDLDHATLMFSEYMGGKASFSRINVRYMDHDAMMQVLDGVHPFPEDD